MEASESTQKCRVWEVLCVPWCGRPLSEKRVARAHKRLTRHNERSPRQGSENMLIIVQARLTLERSSRPYTFVSSGVVGRMFFYISKGKH